MGIIFVIIIYYFPIFNAMYVVVMRSRSNKKVSFYYLCLCLVLLQVAPCRSLFRWGCGDTKETWYCAGLLNMDCCTVKAIVRRNCTEMPFRTVNEPATGACPIQTTHLGANSRKEQVAESVTWTKIIYQLSNKVYHLSYVNFEKRERDNCSRQV